MIGLLHKNARRNSYFQEKDSGQTILRFGLTLFKTWMSSSLGIISLIKLHCIQFLWFVNMFNSNNRESTYTNEGNYKMYMQPK